jgi:hypothetical protein
LLDSIRPGDQSEARIEALQKMKEIGTIDEAECQRQQRDLLRGARPHDLDNCSAFRRSF